MDYLKSTFYEALAQEQNLFVNNGRIFIKNRHWAPEEILEALLSEEAFKDFFKDWVVERTEDLVSQADEILNKHDQHDRFRLLVETYKRGNVVPFVGAGLSIPSGYPGWTDFLRRQRRQTLVTEDELEQLLLNGRYEEAAQVLADALGAGFNEAVESSFGCIRDLFGPVQFLPYVFESTVITTNFDDLIKRSYDNAMCPFSEVLPGAQADELLRSLGAGRKILLKLHGTSTTGRGRILTHSEYNRHYSAEHTLKNAIETICTRTLLFVGCSLTVDRTLSIIKDMVEEKGHDNLCRHYAFLEDPASDGERFYRRDQLLACNIYPIWYPQGEHDDSIEALLAKLKEGAR